MIKSKQFTQFKKDIDEAAALAPAIPKLVGLTKMVAPKAAKFGLNALKFGTAVPVGLGIANVLKAKGNGESNFEKLRKQQQAGQGEDLKKKVEADAKKPNTKERIKNALVDAGLNYKKGLSVKPEDVKGKKYRTDDMKGESPADYVRRMMKDRLRKKDK